MFRVMFRRYESKLLELALRVLKVAASRSLHQRVDTDEVRLALRVVLPFVKSDYPLKSFWDHAGLGIGTSHRIGCHGDYRLIKHALQEAGWDAAIEDFPPEQLPVLAGFRLDADREAIVARYATLDRSATPRERQPARLVMQGDWAFAISRSAWGDRHLDAKRWTFPRRVMTTTGKPMDVAVSNVRDPANPFWRGVLAQPGSRCIIPASAYSEVIGDAGETRALRWLSVPSAPIFSLAAVCLPHPVEGSSFAVMTCEANVVVATIQPVGMPVILLEEDEERWLHGIGTGGADLIAPFPSQLMAIETDDAAPTGPASERPGRAPS